MGQWLKAHGEAIYGAGRTPFSEEFGEYATKLKSREGKPVFLAYNEWRCTTKPGKLYFTIFHIEREGESGYFALPAFQRALDQLLSRRVFDVVIISAGLFLAPWGWLQWPIYLLAAMAWITVFQRILFVRRQLREIAEAPAPDSAAV